MCEKCKEKFSQANPSFVKIAEEMREEIVDILVKADTNINAELKEAMTQSIGEEPDKDTINVMAMMFAPYLVGYLAGSTCAHRPTALDGMEEMFISGLTMGVAKVGAEEAETRH